MHNDDSEPRLYGRVPVTSFAVHVTYTCPLACKHCCFSSSPENQDRLHLEHICATIAEIPEGTRMVAFTGGEPFLLAKGLDKIVGLAASRGFTTRVVTIAYWAKSQTFALNRLKRLRAAGLDELSISWDDFHEEFVDFSCVRNAFDAAVSVGITPAVSIVEGATSRWDGDRVRLELGLPDDSAAVIVESSLNLTGRAEKELVDLGLRPERLVGPCPYVLTGPTLSAKNHLLACCGVIPDTPGLYIQENFESHQLNAALEAASKSVLLNLLFLRGPYDIIDYISRTFDVEPVSRDSLGGNCEACSVLFHTERFSKHIDEAMELRSAEVGAELAVLDMLGLLNPSDIMEIWGEAGWISESRPIKDRATTS